MATIRFDPQWAILETSGTFSPGIPSSMPLFSKLHLSFDMQEILNIISKSQIQHKYLHVKVNDGDRLMYFQTYLMYNQDPPSEQIPPQNEITFRSVYTYVVKPRAGYETTSLDDSFARAGPTGPIHLNLQQAINQGTQGITISPTTFDSEPLNVSEVFIELVGDFENSRPTPIGPMGGIIHNRFETLLLNWYHNSSLDQVSYELRYRIKGSSDWITEEEETSRNLHLLPAETLSLGEYEWQVRTTSAYGFISPWSHAQVFNSAEITPSPIFIKPVQGSEVEVSDLLVEWDSIGQYQYEFELLQNNNVVWTDARISSNQELEIKNILENNQSYRLRLRVNQEGNFYSPWVSISIEVDYTEPASPILEILPNTDESHLRIFINNPIPVNTEPGAVSQELFKREQGGSWVKLAYLLPNSVYIDYVVASDRIYEYRVTVHGNNSTSKISDVFNGSVSIKNTLINLTSEPSQMIRLIMNPNKSFNKSYSSTTKAFAGRSLPVTEFGELIDQTGTLNFEVDQTALNSLQEFLQRRETLLYRDSRGRKMYVTVSNISVADIIRNLDSYDISLSLQEVFYKEGID